MPPISHLSTIAWKLHWRLAYTQAHRIGMSNEDAEDCAMEFVTKMLLHNSKVPPTSQPEEHTRWLCKCAHNHVCNYQRSLTAYACHNLPWSPQESDEEIIRSRELPDPSSLTEQQAICSELWEQMKRALEQVAPIPRSFFVAHCLNGVSVAQLAVSHQRTPHAVEQSLTRTRQRLRRLLEEMGWTEAELRGL